MKKIVVALILMLVPASGSYAQMGGGPQGGGRYATPYVHIAGAVPLSNSADTYNTGIHGDLGVEIASATAVSRLGWRATIGFNHFGLKSSTDTIGKALDITSGNADIVLALHPATSPVGIYAIAGGGFYQHKTRFQTSGLSLDRTTNSFGLDGGLTLRLIETHVSPELEARGHVVFSSDQRITYLTIGVGVVVNRRRHR